MSARATAPSAAAYDPVKTGFFRFRRLGAKVLITNDVGRWQLLTEDEFRRFCGGALGEDDPLFGRLVRAGFVRNHLDFEGLAAAWRARHRSLWQGPRRHVIAPEDGARAMSVETAERTVDRVFESPSPALDVELAGGEPLANWPAVRAVVERARRRAGETGRDLRLTLVTGLDGLDDERLRFLTEGSVRVRAPLDGPADLHDRNRELLGGAAHADVLRWLARLPGLETRPRVTRGALTRAAEIVEEYARLGAPGIRLEPLERLGLAPETWARAGYPPEDFLAFYRAALERALEQDAAKPFCEGLARDFLARILDDAAPRAGAAAELAYGPDGSIYAGLDALRLAASGDGSFRLGHVRAQGPREAAAHPAARALAVAACLDNQPDCARCAYHPYHDVSPVQCYAEQDDILGRMPTNSRCRVHKGVLDLLFEKLQDRGAEGALRGWLARPETE